MAGQIARWTLFHLFIFVMLAIDLGVVRRKSEVVTAKSATMWTLLWVGLSLAFGAGIWRFSGDEHALQFLTGYVIEYALSVDNLFVFLLVFTFFKVRPEYRHKLLFWGILGAFGMRASLILLGTALIRRFTWLLYLFGAFLIYAAAKLVFSEDSEFEPEKSAVFKLARRVLPVARDDDDTGQAFFVRERGAFKVTPLFLVLLVVETTDLLFAMDSIPAVLAVSHDPFIVYTSNVCAILGLRSLFFLVASLMDKFRYLKPALAVILAFVGLKMLADHWVHVPILVSLGVIAGVLALSVVASMVLPSKEVTERPR